MLLIDLQCQDFELFSVYYDKLVCLYSVKAIFLVYANGHAQACGRMQDSVTRTLPGGDRPGNHGGYIKAWGVMVSKIGYQVIARDL